LSGLWPDIRHGMIHGKRTIWDQVHGFWAHLPG
jgi:hypothetical protein